MDRRSYLKHFGILTSGTGVAQLITFVSYAALARLYSPADFGVLALFTTVVTIVGAVASARFEIVIPMASQAERRAVLWLCTTLSALTGMLAAATVALWYAITGALPVPALPLLVGAGVFLTGFTASGSSYLLRNDHYTWVSRTVVLRAGGVALVQVGFALIHGGGFGLIFGYCAGLLLQAAWLTFFLRCTDWRKGPRRVHMATIFKRYRSQALLDVPTSLLSTVSATTLNVTLLFLYNETAVGFYALANRLVVVPLKTVNDGLARVFFQKAAQAQQRRGSFWGEMKFNLLVSGGFSVALMIVLLVAARPAIAVYLGREWLPSADLLVIMAPMLALRSIATSVATTVFILRKVQWRLYHNLAYLALHGIAFAIALAGDLGVYSYIAVVSVLHGLELAGWITVLTLAARRASALGSPRSVAPAHSAE